MKLMGNWTDKGKYYFTQQVIKLWNVLPVIASCVEQISEEAAYKFY